MNCSKAHLKYSTIISNAEWLELMTKTQKCDALMS